MKRRFGILLAVVAMLAAFALVRFAVLAHGSRSGEAPGLVSGALAPCPATPNCVCSEFRDDAAHYVEPLDHSGASPERAWSEIPRIVEALGGKVAVASDGYIAATFASSLFGFIDDVEFRLEPSREQIQIRSASRVGHSDLGVNRKRVEAMTHSFRQSMRGGANGERSSH